MDNEKNAAAVELSNAQRASELQTQGGTDLETTRLDRPADLDRPGGDVVGYEKKEWGPLTTIPAEENVPAPLDPSGEDPFIPGTAATPRDFDANQMLDDKGEDARDRIRRDDPTGDNGPTYEAHQGTNLTDDGGTTDPHNNLTHGNSGLER